MTAVRLPTISFAYTLTYINVSIVCIAMSKNNPSITYCWGDREWQGRPEAVLLHWSSQNTPAQCLPNLQLWSDILEQLIVVVLKPKKGCTVIFSFAWLFPCPFCSGQEFKIVFRDVHTYIDMISSMYLIKHNINEVLLLGDLWKILMKF